MRSADRRVIIADSRPDIRRMVQEIVTRLRYPVFVTTDISAAVRMWTDERASILLSDGTLLCQSWPAIGRQVQSNAARLVVMSGYDPEDLVELQGIAYAGFLHKPFDIMTLQIVLALISPPAFSTLST
jgi:DNA-binding NtrC family response regulator